MQSAGKFCREAEKHEDDATWSIFCIDNPRDPYPVDVSDVEHTPGKYELRHNEVVFLTTTVGRVTPSDMNDDPMTLMARGVRRSGDMALDSLLSQTDRLQAELARERDRLDRVQKDNDKIREENHNLREEHRKMSIQMTEASSTENMLHEGIGLAREVFMAYQSKDFMDKLKERMTLVLPHLDDKDRDMAVYIFDKVAKLDVFRMPELAAPQPH